MPTPCAPCSPPCASGSKTMPRKILISVVAVLTAYSQQPPAAAPPKAIDDGVAKFTSSSQLVIEVVTIKDKSGKPIEGLTAKDFVITEDGKPQTISFCEYQQLKESADPLLGAPLPAAPAPPPPDPSKPKPDPIFQSQIAPERPRDIRYTDRRLIALY